MAGSFEGVLANIPGYGGYLAKETYNRNQTLGDIQQMSGVQGLMAKMQEQQMAQGIRSVLSDASIPDDQKIQKLAQFGEPGVKVAQSLAAMQKQTADMAEQKRLRELRPALMAKYTTPAQPAVAGNVTPTGGMMGFQSGTAEDDGAQGVSPAVPAGFDTRGFLREAATQGLIPTETYFNHEAQLEDKKQARIDQHKREIEAIRVKAEEGRISRAEADQRMKELKMLIAGIAASNRHEPAPSLTQIVDPTDPTKMLSIDARQYRGGGIGSPGVIGIAGKEPAAAKRDEQVGQGRETVSTVVGDLRSAYENLQKGGGIVSTKDSGATNAVSALQSSGVGQAVGHVFGTDNQNQREIIGTTRPLLMQAIKTATGMSAKQMDSNVELKMWLATATDPKLGLEANMHALDMIDKLYGTGSGAPKQPGRADAGRIGSAGKVMKISGDAEYNMLPKGARYVGPDGVERVK